MGAIVVHGVDRVYQGHAKNVSDIVAVQDIGFTIENQEIVCVVGPSGCGKSTILNLIAGFEAPSEGSIVVGGRNVDAAGPDRMVVFQSPALFPWMTVWENVIFGPKMQGIPKERYVPDAERFIGAVDLEKFTSHYPYQLSGGMRQRVQIARALLNRPEVLLMDEPFGALDFQTRLSMQELLLKVWADFKPTILFITHDVEEAAFLGDRVLVMSKRPGRIKEDIRVPFAKPRTFKLLTEPGFVEIKERVLHLIREENGQR